MGNDIRSIIWVVILFIGCAIQAQNSFRNFGNLKVFENAHLGFHTNLVNDGPFDENKGWVGFYQHDKLSISGTLSPTFSDLEIAVENGLFINIPMNISNSLSFVYGDIFSPKLSTGIYTHIAGSAYYIGETDTAKANGYVAVDGQETFLFPTGDTTLLRPLGIEFMNGALAASCAYFFENPENPQNLSKQFPLQNKDSTLELVCATEFWDINTTGFVKVTLTWDELSTDISLLENKENLTVAGWNTEKQVWENLGVMNHGTYNSQREVTSTVFRADNYDIVTLAKGATTDILKISNYLLTTNNDGVNDSFIIEEIKDFPNNLLQIFNRHGVLVYTKENYKDEFKGMSNQKVVLGKTSELPSGIYFYIVILKDVQQKHQGYLYLSSSDGNK